MGTLIWNPDQTFLNNILSILRDAEVPETSVQCRVTDAINHFNQINDSVCYYAYILAYARDQHEEIRQRAGLLLKSRIPHLLTSINTSKAFASANGQSLVHASPLEKENLAILSYVVSSSMKAMCDELNVIRQTSATILTTIARCETNDQSFELLSFFIQLLDHANSDIRNTSFRAIAMIIEDKMRCDYKELDLNFLSFCNKALLPRLLAAYHYDSTFRYYSLMCLNYFASRGIFSPNEPFFPHLQTYWELLGQLALDMSLDVRQETLRGMGFMVMRWYSVVSESLNALFSFLLDCIEPSQPYLIKFEASDVLRHIVFICEDEAPLKEIIPIALPRLFENTRYSEWDYAQMDQQHFEDNSDTYYEGKKDVEIFTNSHRFEIQDDEVADDSEEKDNESFTSTWGTNWTLRKASAVLIDRFAFRFQSLILPYVLPRIEQWLQKEKEWELRETAILVLGAIGRGCLEGLEPFLPKIIDVLIRVCDDTRPILRSISVWAISRFSVWLCGQLDILDTVIEIMQKRILDSNKCVQEAACSAFAYLEETAEDLLLPYLPSILETFHKAFSVLHGRNVIVLLDAIIVLVEVLDVWHDLPLIHEHIVEPLLERWVNESCECPSFNALCECVGRLIFEAHKDIAPYKTIIWERSLNLIIQGLNEFNSLNTLQDINPTTSLNSTNTLAVEYRSNVYPSQIGLESGIHILYMMCNIFNEEIQPFIQSRNSLDAIQRCYRDMAHHHRVHTSVKHDCLGILGYAFMYAASIFCSTMPPNVVLSLLSMDVQSQVLGISCNAVWALGKFIVHVVPVLNSSDTVIFSNYTEILMKDLASRFIVYKDAQDHSTIYDALVVTLPHLARVSSSSALPFSKEAFQLYCTHLLSFKSIYLRADAVEGLMTLINVDPSLAFQCLPLCLQVILSFYVDSHGLQNTACEKEPVVELLRFRDTLVLTLAKLKTMDVGQFTNALLSLEVPFQEAYNNLSNSH